MSKIEDFAKNWDNTFNAADLAKLATFYAASARAVPAGGSPVDGPKAIADFFADVRSKGLTTHQIEVLNTSEHGNIAIATGTWSLTASSGADKFGGNWVNVLERDGEGWKILLHTWN